MNHFRSVGITLLALSMGLGGFASAQGRNDRYDRNDRSDRHDRYGRSHGSSHGDYRDHRGYRADTNWQRGYQGYNQRGEWRDQSGQWRGAGPRHDLRRGGYLTPQYRSHYYVVDNWRGHHLSAPPRGYHWVQAGNDYVLAAIATGVILQILFNR